MSFRDTECPWHAHHHPVAPSTPQAPRFCAVSGLSALDRPCFVPHPHSGGSWHGASISDLRVPVSWSWWARWSHILPLLGFRSGSDQWSGPATLWLPAGPWDPWPVGSFVGVFQGGSWGFSNKGLWGARLPLPLPWACFPEVLCAATMVEWVGERSFLFKTKPQAVTHFHSPVLGTDS